MVKVSKIYKTIIIICVSIMMGLHLMTPSEIIGVNTIKIIVGFIGIIIGISSFLNLKHIRGGKQYTKLLKRYIVPYCIAVFIAAIYTFFRYNYSITELLVAVTPYMYVFFSVPLLYVFITDGTPFLFLKKVVTVVLAFLGLKSVAWYLYNFRGITIFPRWIFEYGEQWIRYGLLRVNVGYLNGLTLLFCSYMGVRKKGSRAYLVALIGVVLFLNYVTRMRFLLAVSLVSIFIYLYYSVEKNKLYIIRRLGLLMIVAYVLTSDTLLQFINSFSLSGDLSWSTAARILTIKYYWNIIKEKNLVLGLGLLISDNANAATILGTGLRYYLEDVGIIGGIIKFGILSIVIYGLLFYYAMRTCYIAYKKNDTVIWPFTFALCSYMILSCMLLNIYDMQRSFDVPFYLSIISFTYGKSILNNSDNKSHFISKQSAFVANNTKHV